MKISAAEMMNLTYCALKNRNVKENNSDSINPTKEELKKTGAFSRKLLFYLI